jgi:uncharacterized protein
MLMPEMRRETQSIPECNSSRSRRSVVRSRSALQFSKLLTLAVAILAACATLAAQTFPKPTGYINDFAGVLSPEIKTQLEALSTEVKEKTGAEVAVAIVNSLEGDSVENYATQLAEQWGVGDENDRGALLLLAVQDRGLRLDVGYGLEPILTDGMAGEVLDQVTPYLGRGDYDGGVRVGVARVAQIIAADAGVRLTGMPSAAPPQRERKWRPGGWLSLLFILPFLLFPRRRRSGGWRGDAITTAWMLGSLGGLGRRGPGGGHGGLGGGGFGGFGGGGFGGGGASRSW